MTSWDVRALSESGHDNGAAATVLWKLADSGRQLDANLVRLRPDERIARHTETDLDVLLLGGAGDGLVGTGAADEPQRVAEGGLLWLPRGTTRSITAGPGGLTYLTVHPRRPGMTIGRRPAAAAENAAEPETDA
jgi:quercetin dioxygenase-like cupin family protein